MIHWLLLGNSVGLGRPIPAPPEPPANWDELWTQASHMPGHDSKPNMGRQQGSKKITRLYEHTPDQIFIGYGDWDINDGATDLVSYNPSTDVYTIHETAVPTEAFEEFRSFDGILYAPFIDSTGYWELTEPYTTVPKQDVGSSNWVHVFDVNKHNGLLWVFGSTHYQKEDSTWSGIATASFSKDRGLTWEHTFPGNHVGSYARATSSGVDPNGSLWCKVYDFKYTWRNSQWVQVGYMPDKSYNVYPEFNIPPKTTSIIKGTTHWVAGDIHGNIFTKEIL